MPEKNNIEDKLVKLLQRVVDRLGISLVFWIFSQKKAHAYQRTLSETS